MSNGDDRLVVEKAAVQRRLEQGVGLDINGGLNKRLARSSRCLCRPSRGVQVMCTAASGGPRKDVIVVRLLLRPPRTDFIVAQLRAKGGPRTVASSKTRILLGANNARAREISCRCPWLRLDP
jgi:hypothetical protein